MEKASKKIIKRLIVTLSAATVCCGVIFGSYHYMENKSLPTIGSVQSDKPVIVLDAGHGECS